MKHLFSLLTLTFFLFQSASAQPPGWLYQVPITVYENSGSTLTDHQVPIIFNTAAEIAANRMQPDGGDIRFGESCNGNPLEYWIEGYMNTDTTKIWVKVPNIPANDSVSIMMFHGMLGVSTQSDINIFEGPYSGNDSLTSAGALTQGAPNRQRGFFFNGSRDLLVTQFGKYEPNGTTRYVTLFDSISQAQIHQIQVSGAASTLSYGSVGQPLWLNRYQSYLISIYLDTGDQYFNSSGNTQVGPYLTYGRTGWCNTCDQNTFPTNATTGHFGFPDFEYYVRDSASVYPTYQIKSALSVAVGPDPGICLGDSTQMNGMWDGGVGPYSFQWIPPSHVSNTTIPDPWLYLDPGQTMMIVTDDLGCTSNDTLEAFGLPQPNVDLGPDTAACGVVVLDAGPFDSFLWQDGSTNQTYDVTIPGIYYVTATSAAGCSDTDSVFVDFCVGIGLSTDEAFNVYPNPTNGQISIDLGDEFRNVQVVVSDLSGRAVQSLSFNQSQKLNLEIESAPGLYLLTITAGDKSANIRILKE